MKINIQIFYQNAMRRFIRCGLCCVVVFLLLHPGDVLCEDSWEDWKRRSGPIPIANQTPVQLLFLQPVPDRADTVPKGHTSARLNTNITNTLVSQSSAHYSATVDTEMIRTSLEMSHGLLTALEIGLSIPVAHYYCGILDKPIREVERFFGKIRNVRREEDPGHVTYFVKKGKDVLISNPGNSTGIGDLVLRAKARVWDEGNGSPLLSVRLAVKLPTGDEDRAFGSGEVDWGAGLLLQKDWDRMSLYLNGDVVFPGETFDYAGVSLREFYSAMVGVEYGYTPRFSVLTQLNWLTRPFEGTGLELLDRRIWELLIGVNYRTETGVFFQAGGMEDIYSSDGAGADVTFFLNAGFDF